MDDTFEMEARESYLISFTQDAKALQVCYAGRDELLVFRISGAALRTFMHLRLDAISGDV